MDACSGSAYVATAHIANIFKSEGFVELQEKEIWKLEKLGKYFVRRNESAIIAFAVGGEYEVGNGFTIVGAHLDSPSLKLKPNAFKKENSLNTLRCEVYGGGIWQTWFDRDLGVSGRVLTENNGKIQNVPISIKEPLYRIATCAPHLDKRYPKGFTINKETELPAIGLSKEDLMELIQSKVGGDRIIETDLYLCDIQKANLLGVNDEFVVSQGLDDLICSYGAVFGTINACQQESFQKNKNVLMSCIFDFEEIGSMSRRGADSVMLPNLMDRISGCFYTKGNFVQLNQIGKHKTIVLSTDVGHATHPNYNGKGESSHPVYMNKGLVFETSCSYDLMGDINVLHIMELLAKNVDVHFQITVKKQEKGGGGSTIGPMISSRTGLNVIDFGVPLLSMHSIREVAGVDDVETLRKIIQETMEHFYDHQTSLQ
ncbi:aspartyl aminopeptidase [Entamoeba marina]